MSDGSDIGTYMLKDIGPGHISQTRSPLVDAGGLLYFQAYSTTSGHELWKTDGSQAGTSLVRDIVPGISSSSPSWLTSVGGQVFFRAYTPESGGEVWVTDGTPEATRMVKDIRPGPAGSNPYYLLEWGRELFFIAKNDSGIEYLWKSDGTSQHTREIISFQNISTENHAIIGDLMYFNRDGTELWRSNGTTGGTRQLKIFSRGWIPWGIGEHLPYFHELNGNAVFLAGDQIHGWELWTSDGTERGTMLLKDIYPGTSDGFPRGITPAFASDGRTLYFGADDGVHGVELWKSDGTEAGTTLVKDIVPDQRGSYPEHLRVVGDIVYFLVRTGYGDWGPTGEIWRSDGTAEGTRRLVDVEFTFRISSQELSSVGNTLYFSAYDTTYGDELWAINLSPLTHAGDFPGRPQKFSLLQNYPNPFNPATTIRYSIGERGHIRLKISNILGMDVATLVDQVANPGNYEVRFIPESLPNGVYYYQLIGRGKVETKKMLLVK